MTLDFSNEAWRENLPETGSHSAKLTDMKFIPKEDITWLVMTWTLEGGAVVEELLGIDAPKDSPMLAKTANGKRRIMRLCEMHDIQPKFGSYDEILAALVGREATIVVAHRQKGGIDEPVIRGMSAPKPKEKDQQSKASSGR